MAGEAEVRVAPQPLLWLPAPVWVLLASGGCVPAVPCPGQALPPGADPHPVPLVQQARP